MRCPKYTSSNKVKNGIVKSKQRYKCSNCHFNFTVELKSAMSDYWVNFAKTGNPNRAGLPEWKSYDKQTGNILELGDQIMIRPKILKVEFDFLENAE